MTVLSFELMFDFHAQENGTMVATCAQIPILVAGHDADSLADTLVRTLRRVITRLEALEDLAKAQAYLAENGVESLFASGLTEIGFDEERVRSQVRDWAARHVEQPTLHFSIAA